MLNVQRGRVPAPRGSWALLLVFAWCTPANATNATRRFAIDDYFQLRSILEVAVASDGMRLAYVWQRQSLLHNRPERQLVVVDLRSSAEITVPADNISNLAWKPGSHLLAYLSAQSGTNEVFVWDLTHGPPSQRTNSKDPVEKFRFSSDGKIAFSTRKPIDPRERIAHSLQTGNKGVVLDSDELELWDFVAGSQRTPPGRASVWLSDSIDHQKRIDVPGDVQDFYWSASGRQLSVTYIDDDLPTMLISSVLSTVAVVDTRTLAFRVLCAGLPPHDGTPGEGCSGGEWIPDAPAIMIRKVRFTDIWASDRFPSWAIANTQTAQLEQLAFRYTCEAYGPVYYPANQQTVLVENTQNGVRGLHEWTLRGARRLDFGEPQSSSSSRFAFDRDRKVIAFVNEGFSRPPELYIWRKETGKAEQYSHLNEELLRRDLPTSTELRWTSADGESVSGWLLLPSAPKPEHGFPLLTLVHGGPFYAFTNQFASFFTAWPYPLEALVSNGIAVFVPNYRGSGSYGARIAMVAAIDREPVDDIVSGIEHLIRLRIADRRVLGLAGHSYGAWLGPLVVARKKDLFRAVSFAEGWGNQFAMYASMDGRANREIHDVKSGNPYAFPERYIELSPDLNYRSVTAAGLFEGGAVANGFYMLSMAKASRREGLPTELVIYPGAGHILTSPVLQQNAAERNFDWFRFWLLAEISEDPSKANQYQRWTKVAGQRGIVAHKGSRQF